MVPFCPGLAEMPDRHRRGPGEEEDAEDDEASGADGEGRVLGAACDCRVGTEGCLRCLVIPRVLARSSQTARASRCTCTDLIIEGVRNAVGFVLSSGRRWCCREGLTRPEADPGVRASLLGTVRRANGELQGMYGGWPRYLWIGDQRPVQASGQADDMGLWHALRS
jgi:Secreted repeat of unknown function